MVLKKLLNTVYFSKYLKINSVNSETTTSHLYLDQALIRVSIYLSKSIFGLTKVSPYSGSFTHSGWRLNFVGSSNQDPYCYRIVSTSLTRFRSVYYCLVSFSEDI